MATLAVIPCLSSACKSGPLHFLPAAKVDRRNAAAGEVAGGGKDRAGIRSRSRVSDSNIATSVEAFPVSLSRRPYGECQNDSASKQESCQHAICSLKTEETV